MSLLYPKISSFDPNYAYRFRRLDELNDITDTTNKSKFRLSSGLQYYLQKYWHELDIPRLCRALAVPGKIAENFTEYKKTKEEQRGRLNDLTDLTNRITSTLDGYVRNEKCHSITTANLNSDQKGAICTDINEVAVYLRMYYNIETIKLDPLISSEYPYGNPFSDIVDIMCNGAIIIRFKYVSRNRSTPQEKLVSYHLMEFKDERVLGVHVQGDSKFSMYKQLGQGD